MEKELELVKIFKNKTSGLTYCLFTSTDNDEVDEYVRLYCNQDDSGNSDIKISTKELRENYELEYQYLAD